MPIAEELKLTPTDFRAKTSPVLARQEKTSLDVRPRSAGPSSPQTADKPDFLTLLLQVPTERMVRPRSNSSPLGIQGAGRQEEGVKTLSRQNSDASTAPVGESSRDSSPQESGGGGELRPLSRISVGPMPSFRVDGPIKGTQSDDAINRYSSHFQESRFLPDKTHCNHLNKVSSTWHPERRASKVVIHASPKHGSYEHFRIISQKPASQQVNLQNIRLEQDSNMDFRLWWLGDRVVTFLNEKDPMLFLDLLDRDAGNARKLLTEFLNQDLTNSQKSEQRAVYFYKTFYDKIIEEEVVVAEPVIFSEKEDASPHMVVVKKKLKKKVKIDSKKKKEDPGAEGEETEDAVEEPEAAEEREEEKVTEVTEVEEPKTGSGKKKKVNERPKKEKGKTSPRTAVETTPPSEEAPEFVYITKMVQKVVKAPEIHLTVGNLTGDGTPDNLLFIYFLRQNPVPIPACEHKLEALAVMPNYFLFGSTQGKYLSTVSSLLRSVFTPVIRTQFRDPGTVLSRFQKKQTKGDDSVVDEDSTVFAQFMPPSFYRRFSVQVIRSQRSSLQKEVENEGPLQITSAKTEIMQDLKQLSDIISWTLNHLEESITLEMPNVDLSNISSESTQQTLRGCVKSWENHLMQTVANYKAKKPAGEGPIAEVDFWNDRSAGLCLLVEQLRKPAVKNIIDAVTKLNPEFSSGLLLRQSELEAAVREARENVKFLSTIMRHLKVVTFSASFKATSAALPALIEGLHMIWILSRYYNTDDTMVSLMRRVSWTLCKKVASSLKSETLFKEPCPKIITMTHDAQEMLTSWKKFYLETRLKIEITGTGKRWEFDQRRLFSETEYMASVCKDLNAIAVVVQQFLNVFSHEFKAVIKDPTQVDSVVKRVENLVLGIEMTDFDIFKPSCRDNWQAVVETFYKDVKILEREVTFFIDQAFLMLRNSEDALEMLLKFKTVETRPGIKSQLLTKFDVILQELIKEIGQTQEAFQRGKKKPPILRYQPPESGAIFWERLLFMTLKAPILRFQNIAECKDSPFRKEAFEDYVVLAKQMKEFEDIKFENWCKSAIPLCSKALQKSILKLDKQNGEEGGSKLKMRIAKIVSIQRQSSAKSSMTGASKKGFEANMASIASDLATKGKSQSAPSRTAAKSGSVTWSEMATEAVLSDLNLKLKINFSDEIFNVIAEAELLEYLGFKVPAPIRNVALQKNRLHLDLTAVQNMMNEYNQVLEALTPEQLQFTRDYVINVQKHILPGHARLNWNSLGIQEYVKSGSNALKHLIAIIQQAVRIEKELDARIATLKVFNLFEASTQELLDCSVYFQKIDHGRTQAMTKMLSIYHGVGPILIKLESLIHHTDTGTSPKMILFYQYWENKVYNSFVELIVKNLTDFEKALNQRIALFQVSVVLALPNVVLQPNPEELHNLILRSALDCLERFKTFPRWRPNSCLPTEHVTPDGSYLYSFYSDIKVEASEIMQRIQTSAINLAAEVEKNLVCWKKYAPLWTQDLTAKCEAFSSNSPSLSEYDEKLSFYTLLAADIAEMFSFEDVRSIRMNFVPMVEAVEDWCRAWKQELGIRLAQSTRKQMNEFQALITDLLANLSTPIQSLETFKHVLKTISTIQKSTVSSEIMYEEFQEVYHVLAMHKIQVDSEEEKLSMEIKKQWQQLYVTSLYRDQELEPTKERFAAISREDTIVFLENLKEFTTDYETTGPGAITDDLSQGIGVIQEYCTKFEELEAKRQELLLAEALFGLPAADYTGYLGIRENFECLQILYRMYEELLSFKKLTSKYLWATLNTNSLVEGVDGLTKRFRRLQDELKKSRTGVAVERALKEFKTSVSLMIELKSDSLVERHWQMLMDKTGVHFDLAADKFTLENLYEMELFKYPGIVEEIIASAEKEMAIEVSVKEITTTWQKASFKTVAHYLGDEQRGFVLSDVNENIQILEDNAMSLQAMSASQFIGPFMKVVERLEKSLALYGYIIDAWLETQRKWLYLEAIFIGGDIKSQLPDEAKKFDDIDRAFRRIMVEASKRPHVKDCCEVQGRLDELQALSFGLENCQKSLDDYLQLKRNAFPRFFFLSDDELLSVLGSLEPQAIQSHIVKIFDNVGALRLETNSYGSLVVSAMISCENEIMAFQEEVLAQGRIEDWMGHVVSQMRVSNRLLTKKAIFDYGKVRQCRADWMLHYCGMICLAANQVWWTAEVDEIFSKIKKGNHKAMKNYLEKLNSQLNELVVRIQGDLSKNDRKKFNTALIIDVHSRDIVEGFVKKSITDARAFEWESQLLFYWKKDVDNLVVQQCTGSFDYGYEYLGLNARLVITPLTDRIYLTITQALSMHLGGAPAGPAGTGKTETTKDLAKALGLLCMVTNCGEGMDYKSIGKILNGLCQCGAWGCFDEFNRIDLSVLSVISSQLQSIRHALMLKMKRFNFDGQEIAISGQVGIFITMNPGYAGRTELPESLKALFRPVVCIVPDLEMICLIMLLSEGFLKAKPLAKKMTVLYKLAQEQLSKQFHYDFGLRALKSVLVMAGELKRKSGDLDEEIVLMRALRDMNLPKFVHEDVPLFLGLIKDLFPGIECASLKDQCLETAVETALKANHYELVPYQVEKVSQLYETMKTRHATMLVGPSGGGKSVILKTLEEAQNILGIPTVLHTLNPKACSVIKLYGILDPNTRDWIDGLLSSIFREVNQLGHSGEQHYIVFDGDVDALWIENMNSVMDDNKLLTLANGERIRLQPHCMLLFEVGDLMYASPATVSRAGMVFVDPANTSFTSYWQRWLKTRQDKTRNELLDFMFDKYVDAVAKFVVEGWNGVQHGRPLKLIVPLTSLNMLTQLCALLDATLPQKPPYSQQEDESDEEVKDLIECLFIQALFYSFGSSLVSKEREEFDTFTKKLSGMLLVDDTPEKRASLRFLPVAEKTLYDYFVSSTEKCWVAWKWVVPEYKHDLELKFGDIIVPTVDTCRAEWLVKSFRQVNTPFTLIGETGTSKTCVVNNLLRLMPPSINHKLKINFSARTTAQSLQKNLESAVEKRTKRIYGPPMGKKLVIFIDDLNMPLVDEYGTQQPIAFLKLLLEGGGFYDADHIWVTLTDTYFIAAMGKPGGGRAAVDPRFLSKFTTFNMIFPADETICYIYNSILSGHASILSDSIQKVVPSIVNTSVALLKEIMEELPATPPKFHYVFNPRDLSRISAGLCQVQPECFKTADTFVRVWRNEAIRVLCDRLICSEDQYLVKNKIKLHIEDQFPEFAEVALRDPLLFGDFRNACREGEPRFYEDLLDYEAVYFLFQEILVEYRETRGNMQMVLFEHAIEHLTRIHRVLRMDRGHMMIVGVGGSGKKSMTKLAGFASGCDLYEIVLTRSYNLTSFQEDIKNLYQQVGIENRPTVFIFSAAQILEESFLEAVNNMLSVGVVTSMFSEEERDEVVAAMRDESERQGFGNRKDQVWNFFCSRCNLNLHVVLSMSPVGDVLRTRCRSFPGLVNYTTINWFFAWPTEALVSVANVYLAENPEVPEIYRSAAVNHVVHVHTSLTHYSSEFFRKHRRKNYVTPKQFLSYIELYLTFLKDKNKYISLQSERLSSGIRKIAESRIQLDELNDKLTIQKIAVETKTVACEELLKIIKEATDGANEKKNTSTKKKQEMEAQEKTIQSEKAEAESILERALPVLEAARTALSDLDKSDITEIRSFTTPPQAVQTVCECVLYLLGVKDISWKSAKAIMADPNFILKLREINCDQITLTQQRLCKAHAKNLPPDLKASSTAAHGLMMFVQAVLGYCAVYREVKPKKEKVQQLEQDNLDSQKILKKLQIEIEQVEKQLKSLNVRYEEAMRERMCLQEETDLMMKRLVAADKLMSGLSSEDIRWNEELGRLHAERKLIIGDCLLSASFLCYTGPFTYELRTQMIYDDFKQNLEENSIPVSSNFGLERFLCEEVEVSKWNAEGLPSDTFSVQTGILTVKGNKFPFFIDPQKQATNWIKKKEEKWLKITSFSDPDFIKLLEMAIQYGFPLLFEDVEDFVDPIIENVIEKNYVVKGGRTTVLIGDKQVDVDPKFRLYLTSKLANPNVNPSIFAKATVINCTVTTLGLEDQFLSVVVRSERPDLEATREQLIQDTFNNKSLLKTLEDTLLRELSSATGNMLDNKDLVVALEGAKTNASQVKQQLEEAEKTTLDIEALRNQYRPVASRGSMLFFVLLDMAMVSPMYQYSLNAYLEIFSQSLLKVQPGSSLEDRLNNMVNVLTRNVYEFGCLGIFEKHKLLFSFQIAIKLGLSTGTLNQTELDFFAKGNVSLDKPSVVCPVSWLSPDSWGHVLALSTEFPNTFVNLATDLVKHETEWKAWYDAETPENVSLPGDFNKLLSPFQQMLVLRCFRTDRVVRSISNYVTEVMGEAYVAFPTEEMRLIFEKSSAITPVIFFQSPGSDPTSALMNLAESCGKTFKYASLGQGQEQNALALLDLATAQGHWLMLQNCHLLIPFMRHLEKILETLSKPHPDFRLWLTTDATSHFPIGILQRSLKVVTETPNGLQLNLKNTYSKLTSSTLESCQHPLFKSLTFVLAFFHAVVQERRKYDTMGWNVQYDFSEADFQVSLKILGTYLSKPGAKSKVPWESLRYLIGEVMYGGRVIDDYDRRVVKTYVEEYLGDFLFDGFQPFHFYRDFSVSYTVPPPGNLDDYLHYIDNLPLVDKPSVFGLHPNAEIGYYTRCAKNLWHYMIEIQPVGASVEGEMSREEVIDGVCTDILAKTPVKFNLTEIRKKFEMNVTPTTVVLLQELERFNVLISNMTRSLTLLKRALAGEAEMDAVLDDISRSLFNGQLPNVWRQLIPATLKSLGGWIDHFERRTQQYSSWAFGGDPIVMWLSGLHIPKAYLTALVQMACRANGWPLDKCVLSTGVSEFKDADQVERGLHQGCYVEGLYLEGARWDMEMGCLMRSLPKVLLETLPILKVVPIERHHLKQLNTIQTPVYTTSLRRNAMGVGLAFEVDLTTKKHASHWVLQGVCLLLNSD